MIIQETLIIKNKEFVKTYSDENRYVVRDGISYDAAIDPVGTNRVYSEGDIIEEVSQELPELTEFEALEILLGGAS